jgi:nitrogenase molybdenum-iron protein alpha/beta subunit
MINKHEDKTVLDDIKNHVYDLVIYGSYHRGKPHWDLVNKYYKKNEIVLMCGEDEHYCDYPYYCYDGYYVFVRELS